MGEFRMPTLGADMTEGTLLEWLVRPGDAVHHGQVVAVIDTVKTAIDIEVFEDGEVERLLVEPGTTVQVGTPLALLRGAGASPEAVPAAASTPTIAPAPAPAPAAAVPASPIVRHLAHERGVDLAAVVGHGPDGEVTRDDVVAAAPALVERPAARRTAPIPVAPTAGGRVPASPLARTRATELGVDLASVAGSGPHGAVTVADVEAAAGPTPTLEQATVAGAATGTPRTTSRAAGPHDAATAEQRRAAMQAATGALMARSKREIPHYYLESTIDLAAVTAWLSAHNEGRPSTQRVLPSALLLLATARTLRLTPELNGFYTDAGFEPQERVDLGVAVSMRRGGLVVASVRDAAAMSVDEFMAALKGVAERARAGRLRGSEMSVPTITVTNLGDQGADLVHGVIYPPQVALVGFGRVVPRPWAVDGMLAVRPLVVASLAGDHRVSDGHRGSRFLTALDAALQRPEEL